MISILDLSEEGNIVDRDGNPSPYWLTSVRGSTAEERRNSSPRSFYSYNKVVKRARRRFKNCFSLGKLLENPDFFNIKLSELEALYPSTTSVLTINIQDLTKSKGKLLRAFLIYWYSLEGVPAWIRFLVEESIDHILEPIQALPKGKIFRENLIIRQSFLILGNDGGLSLLKEIYSEDNLQRWKKLGESLVNSYEVVRIPLAIVKEKIRRRGYKESSSNKHISKNQEGEVNMSNEARELEETLARIKLKQAKLFEERLDRYLRIESSELSSQRKKEIFNSLLVPENPEEST